MAVTDAAPRDPALDDAVAAPLPAVRRRHLLRDAALSLALLVALLAAWEAFVRLRGLSPLVLPPPGTVARTLAEQLGSGMLLPHLGTTLAEVLLGFLLGSALGAGAGALVAHSALARRILTPYVIASQAMPKLALAPLFVLWLGYDLTPKVVITALIAFFPLFENTVVGLNDVAPEKLELFRMLRASTWQTFVKLRLPTALPYLFAGLRVAMVLSVVGAVVGEYVGANRGLGALIIASQGTLDTPLMFAVFVLLTLLGVGLYLLVAAVERLILAWRWESGARE
ncbi:MAG TPA: ABC transporter permease [Chloroflexota bacterium]|jgi:NitT/TauT family transport system permease protein|nr:ABC transporter permease [Chloroflexota bacterium]